jgi:hypothetical protein
MEKNEKMIIGIAISIMLAGILVPIGLTQFYNNPIVENRRTCLENSDISVIVNGSTPVNASSFNFNNDESYVLGESENDTIEIDTDFDPDDSCIVMQAQIIYENITVSENCYLVNISIPIYVEELTNMSFYVANARNNGTTIIPSTQTYIGSISTPGKPAYWETIQCYFFMNVSETVSNMFFVGYKLNHLNGGAFGIPDSTELNEAKPVFFDVFWRQVKDITFVGYIDMSLICGTCIIGDLLTIDANKTIRIDFTIPSGTSNKTLIYRFFSIQSARITEINGTFDTNLTSSENNKLFTCNTREYDSFNETSFEVSIIVNVTVTNDVIMGFTACYLEVITDSDNIIRLNVLYGIIPIFLTLGIIFLFVKKKYDENN